MDPLAHNTVSAGKEEVPPPGVNRYSGELLKRWKSLEGDWRTFTCSRPNQLERGCATERRSHKSASESPMLLSRHEETEFSGSTSSQESTGFGGGETEGDWCPVNMTFQYKGRSCSSELSKHSEAAEFSSDFQESFHLIDREELRRVVNSSYPLLKENLSLLQKLKKERDVCRQLENDMRDLEGQIQDVTKSFHTTSEADCGEGSGGRSEGEYTSDENVPSPTVDDSYVEVFTGETVEEERFLQASEELDPVAVIETTLSSLMDLAERLEAAVRERDLEMSELMQGNSLRSDHRIPTEWVRPSFHLSRIPSELVDHLQDLQAALRLLLATREWKCTRRHGDRDCSSPASFTFQSFGRGRVLVPTVRTIFSPVGESVEMRPIQQHNGTTKEVEKVWITNNGESYSSSNSLAPCSEIAEDPIPLPPPDEPPDTVELDDFTEAEPELPKDSRTLKNDTLQEPEVLDQCLCPSSEPPLPVFDNQPSADIIKRIERLQELVKPELCESLKQRALRIQKAKEDFLSGVVNPPPEEPPLQESEVLQTDIVIVDVTVPAPNGLTVKDEAEDKKAKLPFLRKKKRQSWCSDDLCRESLVLEEKSDWLRNPFRPKGKYKFNK